MDESQGPPEPSESDRFDESDATLTDVDPANWDEYAVGIDVGGTNIKTVALTPDGRLLYQSHQSTSEHDPAWASSVRGEIEEIEEELGQGASCVGLAAPGLAAPDGRSIAWMQGRMQSLQGLDWTDYLRAPQPIPVLNDAHAALLGETWKGAAAGCRNVVMLTLGTGVGGGAIVDGHLLRGHLGRAGHLGHVSLDPEGSLDIVGTPGSLEDAIGDCTLPQRSHGLYTTTTQLVRSYRAGDAEAGQIWLRSVKALAASIVSFINVLDPEVIILGGGIINAGDALLEPLGRWINTYEWRPTQCRVRIVTAKLGEMAGAWGAAANALHVNGRA